MWPSVRFVFFARSGKAQRKGVVLFLLLWAILHTSPVSPSLIIGEELNVSWPLLGRFWRVLPSFDYFSWGLFQSQAPDEVIEDIIKALKVRCTWKDQQISNDAKSLEL